MATRDTTIVEVEILNWESFNPRKDLKSTSWFRLSNGLLEDPDFFEFSHAELLTWVYILSVASKKMSGTVRIHLGHLERIRSIKPHDSFSAIEKLQQLQCVRISHVGPYADVTSTSRAQHTTNERTNITNEHNEHSARPSFNLENLYKKYPRKEGKQRGLVIAKREVQSQDDYDGLSRAIDRYSEHVRRNATETRFIKHFGSFMGCWKEWLDPETGQESEQRTRSITEILAAEGSALATR